MQHPQDDHLGADDLEDGPIITVRQMAIGGAEQFVFRHQRSPFGKAFQCADLLFQAKDKGGCRIGFVLDNVLPDFDHIRFGCLGDVNPEFSWHA